MKLLKTLAALALALCATLTLAADPPAVVGRLNYVSGPVSFAPAQANEDWSEAVLNRPITTGDRLWTDSTGRAEMHVGSLALRMGAQTSVDVLNLDDRTFQLRLAQGSMNLRVRRLARDQLLEVATPDGAVVVKQPGTYRISVGASSAGTMVTVRSGEAELFTGTSSFLVRDNQQATLSGARQNLFAAPPADEFEQWAVGRDRREDNIVSTRYVPAEMTGYEDLDQYGAWRTEPDYGAVWIPASVPSGWAPYREGHWVWVAPWGWTWVDRAPWGFAPFHYGRWIWLRNHWAWAPGRSVARPVYAPALVAFVGGSNWSLSVGASRAPAVGWVPLGWREPYRPWYRSSPAYVRNVNVTNVNNITNVNIRYVNRSAPSAVTVVSRENFIRARAADQAALQVNPKLLAAAAVTRGSPVATPARASLAASQPGAQPPAAVRSRETVAVSPPPAAARTAVERKGREDKRAAVVANAERPSVRVIDRARRVDLQPSAAQAPAAPVAPAQPAAEAQRPQGQPQDRIRGERAGEKGQLQGQQKGSPAAQAQQQEQLRQQQAQEQQARQQREAEQQKGQRAQQQTQEQQAREQARQQREMEQKKGQQQREAEQQKGQRAQQQAQEQQAREQARQQREMEQKKGQPQREAEQQKGQRAQQQAQEQQVREQARQQREMEQKKGQQQAQEQQARQRELEKREAEQQKGQQQRAQQQAQEQQAREQARQQQLEQQKAQQAQQQRAQQQAQEQQAREHARQQQLEQQKAQQAQQQRAQQQAQEQQAREHARQQQLEQQKAQQAQQQRAQQQEQQQRQQQQAQAREQQLQRERAQKPAPQPAPPAAKPAPKDQPANQEEKGGGRRQRPQTD